MSEIPVQSASAHGAHEAEEFPDDFFNEQSFEQPGSFEQPQSFEQPESFDRPQDATAEIEPASAVDLDSDPFADDLSKELAHAAPKTWFNRTTVIMGRRSSSADSSAGSRSRRTTVRRRRTQCKSRLAGLLPKSRLSARGRTR